MRCEPADVLTLPAQSTSKTRLHRYRWRVLLASMFCYLFYYTGRQTFGFAIPGIQAELGLSKVTLGWVSSGLLWSYAIGFQNMARYGLLVWVPVYFLGPEHKGNSAGPWVTIALPIGMALGAMSSGWLSDRVFASNRSRPIALFMLLAAISTAGLYLLGPSRPMAGMTLLFLSGYFVYGPQAPFWALCPDLLGKQRAGTGTGVMNTFAYAFAGLGEPLVGYIIEHHHNTALVFPIVATACLCGSLLALPIRR